MATKKLQSEVKAKLIADGTIDLRPSRYGLKGYYFSPKMDEMFRYDSLIELLRMKMLDMMDDVISWTKRHGITIKYNLDGEIKNYIPDFLVKKKDSSIILEELKGYEEESKKQAKFKALKKYCKKYKWTASILSYNDISDLCPFFLVKVFIHSVKNITKENYLMSTKILCTGSAGFVMGNFVRRVIYNQNQKKPQDREYTFVSIDRVSSNTTNSMYWNKNHTFHLADIRDAHIIDVIFQFEKPDIVIHGAAESCVDKSLQDSAPFITSNVLGTQNIIDACLKHKAEKLIYFSTDEVYGQLTSENDAPWDENSPLNPRNPYAASKASGELLVKAANQARGLIYNIIRSSNCYGPRQLPEKLIPRAIKSVLEDKEIPVYGQGKQMRDWSYVGDIANGIMSVLEKGENNQTYNICAGQEFSNLEVVNEICKAMGKGHNLIKFVDDPRGAGHDFRYAMNCDKIKQLGWKPEVQFKKQLNDLCVRWYIDNAWWFR